MEVLPNYLQRQTCIEGERGKSWKIQCCQYHDHRHQRQQQRPGPALTRWKRLQEINTTEISTTGLLVSLSLPLLIHSLDTTQQLICEALNAVLARFYDHFEPVPMRLEGLLISLHRLLQVLEASCQGVD